MSLLLFIALGLVAGFIASKIVIKEGQGFVLDLMLGIGGAVLGGWLFNVFGMAGVTGFNVYSLLVASVGATVALLLHHALTRHA